MTSLSSSPREIALGFAIQARAEGSPATEIVANAAIFADFLGGSSDTPTAAAAPATTPTRRKASATPETPAVVETPTVTGDAGSTTSSSAAAGSASQAEQPNAGAQGAAVDVAELNAKVLTAVKEIGRDQTVAILNAHGGGKVPEIPVENHASLLDALTTALADKAAGAGDLT